ncbi:MAG TPA: hypothetical protein VGG66_07790 [Rhizomicrobium sp.]|jgi:hypothetical protein
MAEKTSDDAATAGKPISVVIGIKQDQKVRTFQSRAVDLWAQIAQRARRLPNPLMGKKWVPGAFGRRRDELRVMNITDASRELARESETAPDSSKPLDARYIEKLLRDLNVWPKAFRNSPKRHRK